VTTAAERRRLALAVLGGRSVGDVAAEAGVEPELVARWTEVFVDGGTLRLAGRMDPSSFEARDRFLVLVAHEFRTPLAIIRGWVETLQGAGIPDDVRRDAMAVVLRQVDNLERVASDALDAGAVARGQLRLVVQPVDLRALLRSAAASVRGAPVEVEEGTEMLVIADSARIEQVAGDVLAHALRLSLGDPVRIALEVGDAGQVTTTVSVTGRSLSFEEASELFEPYGRADTSVGTGLGLFLCRALLTAHGGEIGLRSSGATSAFWFRLPSGGPSAGPLVERL
jgi:signal transduction histidine kinase